MIRIQKDVIHLDKNLHEHPVVPRTDEEKKAISNRLNRIEGQVRGIQKMIEEDRYCIDILHQISAINSALKNVGHEVTERHMKHCVSDAIASGDSDHAIEELMEVFKRISK